MRRVLKGLAWFVGAVALLLVIGVVVLMTVDWNRAKPWVNARASAALGRPFAINGSLQVEWERSGWLPRPYVSVDDVHIGPSTNGVSDKEFAALDGADLRVELLPLLAHRVNVPTVRLREPTVHLARAADGRSNWVFGNGDSEPSSWKVRLGRLELDKGKLDYVDAQRKANLHVEITPLKTSYSLDDALKEQEADARRAASTRIGNAADKVASNAKKRGANPDRRTEQTYSFAFTVTGTYQGAAVNASGHLGDVFEARDTSRPFPIQARGTVGNSHLAVIGTLTDPTSPDAINLRLWLSGNSADELYPILGVVLPRTPPYATDGRLVGHFDGDSLRLTYRHFTAQLGGSDLAGDLSYTRGKGTPTLTGGVASEHLRFVDLAPIIGGDATPPDAPKRATSPDRRIPAAPLHTERWKAMDADVDFAAKNVERDAGALPLSDINTHISLKSGALALKPLRFTLAQGSVNGNIAVDGGKTPPPGSITLSMRDVQLKALLAGVESLHSTTLGDVNGDLELAGHGYSVAEILGSADGKLGLLIDDGQVSKSMLEIAGLNVLNYVLTKLFGDEPVRIRCAAASMSAKAGVLTSDLFVVDTENATIRIEGDVNLANETLDLTVRPETKNLRLLSLRTPLHVRGTLSKPDVGVNKGPLIARAAAAVALTTVAPVAALGALVAPSKDRENACRPVLEALKAQRPEARRAPAAKAKGK